LIDQIQLGIAIVFYSMIELLGSTQILKFFLTKSRNRNWLQHLEGLGTLISLDWLSCVPNNEVYSLNVWQVTNVFYLYKNGKWRKYFKAHFRGQSYLKHQFCHIVGYPWH